MEGTPPCSPEVGLAPQHTLCPGGAWAQGWPGNVQDLRHHHAGGRAGRDPWLWAAQPQAWPLSPGVRGPIFGEPLAPPHASGVSLGEGRGSEVDVSDLGSRNYSARTDFYCLVSEEDV